MTRCTNWAIFAPTLLTSLVSTSCLAEESKTLVALPTRYVQELLAQCRAGSGDPSFCKILSDSTDRSRSQRKSSALAEVAPISAPVGVPKENAGTNLAPIDKSIPQRLFVRADPIDNFWYGVTPNGDVSGAKGASITYTDDRVAKTQSATINGMMSYLVVPSTLQDWGATAVAAWVSGNGNWNDPLKKPDNSALRVGLTGQLRLITAAPDQTNTLTNLLFNISPYWQTDFRGNERAGGVNICNGACLAINLSWCRKGSSRLPSFLLDR